ncbi:tRNA intron endonuclease [Methanosalsum zhilinae DSM 4017]|uniref:tRNA-splicing endonuclease n=1 Tax=Methanosalsum zhilinae (strain DSM 4017 / NBRC 107636 / OCM 62 / WeN5) TaxID=679901 RepID=F7XPR9_METZD|nr:tRNA-intron lyase [Methanosalsum zhilinae]AEH60340.1 tRNA intron endonuclease [Methanosalsum zhilinae DSM 4017]
MIARLLEDKVELDKDAIDILYNTGYFGRPRGNVLELSLVEAAYLLYREKISITMDSESLSFPEFFKIASMRHRYFELKYIVYKDLKERGFYVQPSVADFRVYPRGGHPGKTPARSYVYVRSERSSVSITELMKSLNTVSNVRKQMILAIVDEESDITFYEVKKISISGQMEQFNDNLNAESSLLEDRVIVWDKKASSDLYNKGFYGKPLDEDRLQLSLIESAYLLEKNLIQIKDRERDKVLDSDYFFNKASEIEPEFSIKYHVYRDMREKGLVPKTGFKFGTHFRLYIDIESPKKIPHSEYLVHAISENHIFILPIMSRAIRLANSVRKRMVFALNYNGNYEYIDIGRVKM